MKPVHKFIIGKVEFTFLKEDGKWYIDTDINGKLPDTLTQYFKEFAPAYNNEYFSWGAIIEYPNLSLLTPLKEDIDPEEWVEAYNEECYFCKEKPSEIEKQSHLEAIQIMYPNDFTKERNSIIRCSCPLCDETRGRWYKL